jgi:hypothetical protein
MDERREYPRIRMRRKLGLQLSDGSLEYLWTADLSLGGMQVHTEHQVDMGRKFPFFMGVYDAKIEGYVAVRGRVEVVHKVYDGQHRAFRLGLQILSFDGQSADLYQRHLRELELQR